MPTSHAIENPCIIIVNAPKRRFPTVELTLEQPGFELVDQLKNPRRGGPVPSSVVGWTVSWRQGTTEGGLYDG